MKIYPTYEDAARRQAWLAEHAGTWPGIITCPGGWRLLYDPDVFK